MEGLTDWMIPRGSMSTMPSTAAFSTARNHRASPSELPVKSGRGPAPSLISSSVALMPGRSYRPGQLLFELLRGFLLQPGSRRHDEQVARRAVHHFGGDA